MLWELKYRGRRRHQPIVPRVCSLVVASFYLTKRKPGEQKECECLVRARWKKLEAPVNPTPLCFLWESLTLSAVTHILEPAPSQPLCKVVLKLPTQMFQIHLSLSSATEAVDMAESVCCVLGWWGVYQTMCKQTILFLSASLNVPTFY